MWNFDPIHWRLNCAATSVYGWRRKMQRYGGEYGKHYHSFQTRTSWTRQEFIAYQEERLQSLIKHAYKNVPYYNRMMSEAGVLPKDIRHLQDLTKLPVLSKERVRENSLALLSRNFSKSSLIETRTSGSTGSSLKLYSTSSLEQMQHAFLWSRIRRHVSPGARNALFTGRNLRLSSKKHLPPHWVDNWSGNQRLFSIFRLGKSTYHDYVEALNEHPYDFIAGYSSAVSVLARFILKNKITIKHEIGHFYTSSEKLQPESAAVIERAFGCKVWNHYGMNERVGAITEYDCGHLHYDMDYGILEFIKVGELDGLQVAKVIGTTMHNFAWPLIRYDTGDLVLLDPNDQCGCPLNSTPIIREIHGRTGSCLELPDGRTICNITSFSRHCNNIQEIQAVQTSESQIVIRIVPDTLFSSTDEGKALQVFKKVLGDDINLQIEIVSELARTPAGKTLSIINET